MDKYKDFISRYKRHLFFSLVAIFSGFGVYIGYITVDTQKVMVNASLGLTVLYLLYQKIFSPSGNLNRPVGVKIELPKDFIYLIYAFVWAILIFWSGVQVLHLFGF
jgi:hypothetical protein